MHSGKQQARSYIRLAKSIAFTALFGCYQASAVTAKKEALRVSFFAVTALAWPVSAARKWWILFLSLLLQRWLSF